MAEMAEQADGGAWLNIEAHLDEVQQAVLVDRSGMAGLFTGRGSDRPLATWVPADLSGRKPEPPSLGIQHGTGPKLLGRLADQGLALPQSWVKQQDSGKRGLVLAVPVRIAHDEVVAFATTAIALLLPKHDFGMWFVADIASTTN